MKIGFDVDGVLRTGHVGFLKLCGIGGWNDKVDEAYNVQRYSQCWPLLNPYLLALKDDELYAITAVLHKQTLKEKSRWIEFFYGNRIKYLTVEGPQNAWGADYVDIVAARKVEVMLEHGIEVYFDDDPAIIRVMRGLTDKIKFLKFGPWFEEVY